MTTTIPHRTNAAFLATQLQMPDMRNGLIDVIASVAPSSTIPVSYHWPLITGITADLALANVDVYIKVAFAYVSTLASAREVAIILGTCRAVTISAWAVTPIEVMAAESHAAICKVGADTITLEWTAAHNGGNAMIAAAHGFAALSALELQVIKALVWLSVAVLPLQGLSLTETGHHYIDTTKRYFASSLKQVLASAPAEVSGWVTALGTIFEDTMFHKALHPVMMSVKMSVAQAVSTKAKLIAANLGAAAVRIPAVPGDVKAAQALLAVCGKATSLVIEAGGSVNMSTLPPLIALVINAAAGLARVAAVATLNAEVSRRAADASFCLGLVEAELENASMNNHSITKAYSMKKLKDEYTSDYQQGRTLFGQIKKARTAKAEAGELIVRTIR